MNNNLDRPRNYDAVLGTQAPLSQLDVQLIAAHQKSEYDYSDEGDRYCSVSE